MSEPKAREIFECCVNMSEGGDSRVICERSEEEEPGYVSEYACCDFLEDGVK